MTAPKTKSKTCSKCQGNHYLLENIKGWVHGKLCSCFHCEVCDDRGHIFEEDEQGRSSMRECECALLRKRLRKFEKAGIPGKFTGTGIETYNPTHPSQGFAKTVATNYVQDFSTYGEQGLLFMGKPGIGKTHLAVSIIKALILQQGVDGKFVDFFQLLSEIRHGYSQDLSEQALIKPYVQSKVLVIDELAKGRNTEWELTVLDQIIAVRYNEADKVTLFTSNYLPETSSKISSDDKKETLKDKIGDRIYSRLLEMCHFVEMEGEDYRPRMKSDYVSSQARSRSVVAHKKRRAKL